jgi:hypothetical protein
MGEGDVLELLKIANGHLPRVRLEYDRVKTELNSLKAELGNTVRIYQGFCDRNVALKNREDELQLTIKQLESRIALQKPRPNESPSELQESNMDNDNLYDEDGMSHCSPVLSLPDDSDNQYLSFQCKSTKAIIGF